MDYVREIIDASALDQVLTLPQSFQNQKVEILVFPVREQNKISELMEGSITQSLIGAVPHSDISPDEIRLLRVHKNDNTH
jgi:hypothetical protein